MCPAAGSGVRFPVHGRAVKRNRFCFAHKYRMARTEINTMLNHLAVTGSAAGDCDSAEDGIPESPRGEVRIRER